MADQNSPEIFVYKDLRKKILTGELKDQERLVETTLAAQYNVSRLHIKSALRLLEQEQLAEHIRMRGFQVKEFTEEAINEILELRYALDLVTFKRFMSVASKEDISRLRKMTQRIAVFFQNEMIEDAMLDLDSFYSFIYEKSGYIHITAILDKYSDYFKIIRRQTTTDAKLNQEAAQLLVRIMDAIEETNSELLAVLLAQR